MLQRKSSEDIVLSETSTTQKDDCTLTALTQGTQAGTSTEIEGRVIVAWGLQKGKQEVIV